MLEQQHVWCRYLRILYLLKELNDFIRDFELLIKEYFLHFNKVLLAYRAREHI